jgi:transcriptional regulator with XRE-family HTH domain
MKDPRDALDETIRLFNIKASDLAQKSGIDEQMISKYRRKHKDMNSLNLVKLANALPREARSYFYLLLNSQGD